MFSSRPELQIEIEKLTKPLTEMAVGQTVTYDDLRAAVGGPYKPWSLIRARAIVEKETGLRLEAVHGVGIKKISAEDVAGIGSSARRKIGRIAKKQSARLTGLSYNDLSDEVRTKVSIERSLLGAISAASRCSAAKAVEPHVSTGPQVASRVFELLGKGE